MNRRKGPTFGPVYCAMYPELARDVRQHGYALLLHGSMARDFDLLCFPWVEAPDPPQVVVDRLCSEFAIRQIGDPTQKPHGRIAYTLSIGFGECSLDLSFAPIKASADALGAELKPDQPCPHCGTEMGHGAGLGACGLCLMKRRDALPDQVDDWIETRLAQLDAQLAALQGLDDSAELIFSRRDALLAERDLKRAIRQRCESGLKRGTRA